MKRFSISILILVLFVSVYIFCVVAYTFISSINGIDYFEGKSIQGYDAFSRVRRALEEDKDTTNDIIFNVCCGKDAYLNSRFECVNANSSLELGVEDKTSVISGVAVVDENLAQSMIRLDRLVLKYKFQQMCPLDEMTVITWPEGDVCSHYISQKNGFLLELSDDRRSVVSNYSTTSFCLDTMRVREKMYVALLCPCKEKVCMQKCCPKGFYFNTVTSSCKDGTEDDIASYRPSFAKDVSYHLLYNVPNCHGPDRMIVNDDEPEMKDILEDGHLMAFTNEMGPIGRKKFCLDIFSNGNNNASQVNGFYCPNEVKKFGVKKTTPEKVIQASYSSGRRNFADFALFVTVTCLLFFTIKGVV